MSVLKYGEVNLGLVKSVRMDQSPKRDDSQTDTVYYQHRLRAETIFTVLDNGLGLPNIVVGEKTPAEIMARVRHLLLQDRQPLFYSVGGGVVFDIPHGLDANNGPKPVDCNVVGITERTFRVEWIVDVALACPDVKQLFASNRWEQETSYDKRGYAVLSTSGTLAVRSDMRVNPDQLRGIVAPPLPNDFERESRYRLGRDGLTLSYQFTDKQVYLLPPLGCVEADCKFAITTANGGTWKARVSLSLEGRKGLKKKTLMEMAVLMAMRKIESASPIKDKRGKTYISGAAFNEEMFENKVEVQLEALLAQSTRVFVPGGAFFQFGQDLFRAFVTATDTWNVTGVQQYFNAQDKLTEARKREIELDRQRQTKAIQKEHDALVKSPPFQRLGEPLALTDFDQPGLDPGLRGNLDFLEMVAAAFRDPCVIDGIVTRAVNALPPIPIPLPGKPTPPGAPDHASGDVDEAENRLHRQTVGPGTSRLRSFAITDAGQFDREAGMVGKDPFPGAYETWICDIEQKVEGNRGTLPTTVSGGVGRKFQVANPETTVLVKWSCVKLGFPPEVPVVADDNLIHVETTVRLSQVDIAADGITPVFCVAGVSSYESIDPNKVAMRPAVPPWMDVPMRSMPVPIPMTLDLSTDSTGGTSSLRSRGMA